MHEASTLDVRSGGARLAWSALYALAAWLVGYSFLHFDGNVPNTLSYYPKADFDRMVEGTADKPYVGRMLVPLLVSAAEQASPEQLKEAVARVFLSDSFLPDFQLRDYARKRGFPYRMALYYVFSIAMFFGVALAARAAFGQVFGRSTLEANLAGLLYLLAVPLWFRYISYIYDPMTLLLGTWLVYAVAKRNWGLTSVLFLLACVNKETAPLLLPFIIAGLSQKYRFSKKTDDLYKVIAFGFALTAAAFLVQAYRWGHFYSNGGAWTEFHWRDHQMVVFTRYTMSLLYSCLVMGAFLWLALHDLHRKPNLLKLGLVSTFAPLFLASFVFGFVDEIRALFEAFPFVVLLGLPTLLAILAVPTEHRVIRPAQKRIAA